MGTNCYSRPDTVKPLPTQFKISIGSYTQGLKTQLKELMIQTGISGTLKKTLYTIYTHSTPIHTELLITGSESNIDEFIVKAKQVVEDNVSFEVAVTELNIHEGKVIIQKTDERISNRRGSDIGDECATESTLFDDAMVVTNKAKDKGKQVLNFAANLPIISNYTGGLKDKDSLLIKEMPREMITVKSLFHPYSVCSFSMYHTDEISVLKVCIEWRLGIPYDSIELFSTTGEPMKDIYTLLKDKLCIFTDNRITYKFFEKEKDLRAEIEKIVEEPLVYHRIASHGMTMDYLIETFSSMNDKMALDIIQGDLSISGIAALKILQLIKKFNNIN